MKIKFSPIGIYYLLDDEGVGHPLGRPTIMDYKKLRPILINENWTGDAVRYVARDIDVFINVSLRNNDYQLLECLLKNYALPRDQIDKAIEKAIKGKKYEAQVMLTRYKDELGGFSEAIDSINNRFSL